MKPSADSCAPPLLVAITGASGAAYGARLVQALARAGHTVDLMVSDGARRVMKEELGLSTARSASLAELFGLGKEQSRRVRRFPPTDIGAPPASGTYATRGMIICPASMKTCAAIAHGYSDNLITRAADVTLKEGRRLVVVPRETPFSVIHLRNLLALAEAGATVLPAMPGFYHKPKSVEDLVDFLVMKIFDALGLPHEFPHAWRPARGAGEDLE